MRRYERIVATLLSQVAGLLFLACGVPTLKPADVEPVLAQLPIGTPMPEYEPIWTAVLKWYRNPSGRTEADAMRFADNATGYSRRYIAGHSLLLRVGPEPPPFSRSWLRSVVAAGLLQGFCAAPEPKNCPATGAVTYLILANPDMRGEHASIAASERVLDPSRCGRGGVGSMGGFTDAVFELKLKKGQWAVTGRAVTLAGTTGC
jgi:hypothetical protein